MSKLETVDNLNQFLKSLKDITSDLEKDISELRDVLSSKAFISEELNESIRNRLLNISGIQKSFFDEYVTLDIGELPEKTDIAQEALDKFRENIESESKYIEAVNFFMSLHSNDANVQAMLDKRKEYLSSIDISGELSKEVKTALSGYILLFDAYREEDQMKKFPLIFGLAEYFEMEIAREVQFCTFEIIESEDENIISDEIPATEVEVSEVIGDTNSESDDVDDMSPVKDEDINEEIPAEVVDVDEDDSEAIISNETDEVEFVEDKDNDVWAELGVSDKESVIVKENKDLLEVTVVPKSKNFTQKEFRKEITKQLGVLKMECITEAATSKGCTKESICKQYDKPDNCYDDIIDYLVDTGYLRAMKVSGYGELYSVTHRGEKALETFQSAASKAVHSSRNRFSFLTRDERVVPTSNCIISKIIYHNVDEYMKKLYPNNDCEMYGYALGVDGFVKFYPDVIDDKAVAFVGIVSENPLEFKRLGELVVEKAESEDIEQFVIIGIDRKHGRAVSEWVSSIVPQNCSVLYTGFNGEEIYSLDTDEVVILNNGTETPVFEVEEYTDTNEDITGDVELNEESNIDEIVGEEEKDEEQKVDKKDTDKVSDDYETDIDDTDVDEYANDTDNVLWIPEVQKPVVLRTLTEEEMSNHDSIFQKMLVSNQFYAATAYVKALSENIAGYDLVYNQLAYALNDPMNSCSYSSDIIFDVYFNAEKTVSDYFVISAALRNFFLDQFKFDYSIQSLYSKKILQ